MSDRTPPHGAGELNAAPVSLDDALRALPQVAPQASAWPELARRLAAERAAQQVRPGNARRYLRPIGIAAAFVLAFSATLMFRPHPATQAMPDAPMQTAATESAAGASFVHNAANSTNSHDAPAASDASLAALQTRSRALEQWLRDTGAASAPQSAQDLAASAEIEDMIGLVDIQLGAADSTDAAALPLWRRRVALLEDLSTLRYSANALNLHNGIAANGAPANEVNAAPAVWRN